jgi:hypothetical protein
MRGIMKIVKLSKLNTQWLSTVDQGKRLELIAADDNDRELKGVCYPLATILADENNETLLIEIYTEEGTVKSQR